MLGAEVNLKATLEREGKSSGTKTLGRKAMAAHLPRIPVVYEVPESERRCARSSTLVDIGSEISEQLDYVPAKIRWRGDTSREAAQPSFAPKC